MRAINRGFTLIELMIVVAIVGVLAAIALPAYQDFIVRAKLSELLAAIGGCRTAVDEHYQMNGPFPAGWSWNTSTGALAVGCNPNGGGYLNRLTVDSNAVIRVFPQNITSLTTSHRIRWHPVFAADGSRIEEWHCSTNIPSNRWSVLPTYCRQAWYP